VVRVNSGAIRTPWSTFGARLATETSAAHPPNPTRRLLRLVRKIVDVPERDRAAPDRPRHREWTVPTPAAGQRCRAVLTRGRDLVGAAGRGVPARRTWAKVATGWGSGAQGAPHPPRRTRPRRASRPAHAPRSAPSTRRYWMVRSSSAAIAEGDRSATSGTVGSDPVGLASNGRRVVAGTHRVERCRCLRALLDRHGAG
jgi:hypothetical protein